MQRAITAGLALAVACALLVGCSSGDDGPDDAALEPVDVTYSTDAYEGLGAWVDVYDYVPTFQSNGATPAVSAASMADIGALGVRTLFLQPLLDDERSEGTFADEALLREIVAAAHAADIAVVAWYLPRFEDPARDLASARAILEFDEDGITFDGLALDIEWTNSVPDVALRNERLIDLSDSIRAIVGDDAALGAIVLPAVQIEVINQTLWPDFPYEALASHYDVWMPMAYWTFRDGEYRDAYTYTEESIRRLRANLGDDDALMHPIGGIGDLASTTDYERFLEAVEATESIGWSIYDFDTTRSSAWPVLRGP